MNGIKCRKLIRAIFVTLFLCGMMIEAAELSWKNVGTDGDFFTSDNWLDDDSGLTSDNPPATDDKITFGAGSYTVTQALDYISGPMNIGAGVTLECLAPQLGWSSNTYDYVNSGTLRFSSGGSQIWKLWAQPKEEYIVYTPGTLEVDGSTVTLECRKRTFDNSGGAWKIINGGKFIWDLSFCLNGGSVTVDADSSISSYANNIGLTLTDVDFTNEGDMNFYQFETSEKDGLIQYMGLYFAGSSVVENIGTISLTNDATGLRRAETRIRCVDSSTLHNSGTIDVVNNGTSNEFHRAYIMSYLSITNSGNIFLSKGENAGDTYLRVAASDETYIQTNGSIRLEGGAEIVLPTGETATIDGGTIGGNGSIDENLTVASGAGVAFSLRGSTDYDVLTVARTVQLDSDSEVQVSLDGFYPEDTDVFDVLVATGGFVNTDASTLIPVGSLNRGRSLKVEIVGEIAPQTLRLSIQTPPGGTVFLIN